MSRADWLWATLLGCSLLVWDTLFVSLAKGRTTPLTLSREWLATFLAVALGLLAWQCLFALALRRISCHAGASLTRDAASRTHLLASRFSLLAGPTAPLLLTAPFLAAAYLSDPAFHYLSANPIPHALVLWVPALLALACQEATLVWSTASGSGAAWLRKPRVAPLLIFGAFAVLYVFTAGGHLYTPDESYMFFVTQNLAERGSVDIPRDEAAIAAGLAPIIHSKYGLVTSLLALPPYWVSKLVGLEPDPPSPAFPIPNGAYPLIDLLVGPLSAAATCALLFCLVRRLGFGAETSLAMMGIYGMASSAWVYSKTFLSQPPAALFLMGALYLALCPSRWSIRSGVLAGLLLGLAAGTRVEVGLLAAPLAVPLLARLRRDWAGELRPMVGLALALVTAAGITVGWYNLAKTGSVFGTGYGAQGSLAGFSTEPYIGLFGTFLSPGFGLFVYNPVALLGICSLPLLALRRRQEAYLFGSLLLLAALLYGSFGDWFAGFTWANRYLVVFLPYALLPAATLLERPWRNGMGLLLLAGAALLGFAINFLAVLFDFNNGWLDLWSRHANTDLILWDPHYSPILAHVRLLHDFLYTGAKLDLYLYYKLGIPSLVAFVVLFTGLATLAARAALATETVEGWDTGATPSPGGTTSRLSGASLPKAVEG